jgi:LPS export ABC transporter protein LptC
MLRSLLTLMVSVLVIALVVWSLSGLESTTTETQSLDAKKPRYSAKKAEWTHLNTQGVAEFHLTADVVDYYDDRSAKMQGVMIDRLRTGQSPWRLTAPQGTMPPQENRVLLENPVHAVGTLQSGETVDINTPRLWADGTRNELYTGDAVQVSGRNWRATATGLRADLAGEKVALLKNTQVKYASHP